MPNMSYSNDLSFQWHPMTSLIKRFWEAWKAIFQSKRWKTSSFVELVWVYVKASKHTFLTLCSKIYPPVFLHFYLILRFILISKSHVTTRNYKTYIFKKPYLLFQNKMKHTLRPTSCRVRSGLFLFIQLPLSFATALLHLNDPSCLEILSPFRVKTHVIPPA